MSKIKFNDIKLDGSELFSDSETFMNELEDSEMDMIVGGLDKNLKLDVSIDQEISLEVSIDDEHHFTTTAYFPQEPICIKPVEPVCEIKPSYPIFQICCEKPIFWWGGCPVPL